MDMPRPDLRISTRAEGTAEEVKWLIAREIPHLRRYALALVNDSEAADDLVQDCLERATRKRHLLRRRGAVRSWLFRIQYTVFVNSCARRTRRGEVPLEETDPSLALRPEQEGRLVCLDVAQGLARLPVEQRAVIALVALEGVSYDEAADILGVPIGTVRSRLSRGRESLKALGIGADRGGRIREIK